VGDQEAYLTFEKARLAGNAAGVGAVPWAVSREQLAQYWHCKPWEIDEAPAVEIQTQLRILAIRAEAQAWYAKQPKRQR
jgi:hypothetical protein